ncbi:MAG: fimbrillin family protein, partial [Muribaculum sp.]|nr:fimbrillin family protein [Muribaculum sp.]
MKLNKFIYGLSIVAAIGLWSCSEEVSSPDYGSEVFGTPVPLTLTVSRGDALTRTTLTENSEGGLNVEWAESDKIQVVGQDGNKIGELTFSEYAGDSKDKAVFKGVANLVTGTTSVRLWYLGASETPYSAFKNDYIVDGAKPNLVKVMLCKDENDNVAQSGKKEDLNKGDLMYSNETVNIFSDGESTVVDKDVTMVKSLAMARFKISGADGVTNGTLSIKTVNASGNESEIPYRIYYSPYDAENIATSAAPSKAFAIEGVSNGSDVYVTLPTLSNAKLKFTLTSGSDTYEYTTSQANTLEAGKYYCALSNGAADGIEVKMQKKVAVNLDYIFGLKWANNNTQSIISLDNNNDTWILSYIPFISLRSQGYPDDATNDYENNPYVSYYQWDREFGFVGIYSESGNRYPQLNNYYDDNWAPIPGDGKDMGWNDDYAQYWYSTSQCQNNDLNNTYNKLYYPSNSNDWLKDHTAKEWQSKMSLYSMSAIPSGFKMPSKENWENLLLNESTSSVTYDVKYAFDHSNDKVKPYIQLPLKVKNQS